jgi:hypothetical protein
MWIRKWIYLIAGSEQKWSGFGAKTKGNASFPGGYERSILCLAGATRVDTRSRTRATEAGPTLKPYPFFPFFFLFSFPFPTKFLHH